MDGTAVADVAIRWSLMDTISSDIDTHNYYYHAHFRSVCYADVLIPFLVAVWKNAIVGRIFVKFIFWGFSLKFDNTYPFLGAFEKLRKAAISFVMSDHLSVRPSVLPHGTTRLLVDEFS
jgi:hypothetical protein